MTKTAIAETAARIMHEQCLQDYGLAKRKALEALSLPLQSTLPENRLINQALQKRLTRFATDADRAWQQQIKQAALNASEFLAHFNHAFGGSLAFNAIKQEDRLEILLYHDQTEALLWHLQDHSIPYREQERILRISRNQEQNYPCFSFVAGEVPVSITVFPDSRPRPRPCDTDGEALPTLKPSRLL